MLKFKNLFINPIQFMNFLDKKPEIIFPFVLSSVTPLLSIKPVLIQFEVVEARWVILISILISLFSMITFFITSFVIYLLLSLILLEREVLFKKVISIYGYIQFPKFILTALVSIFPKFNSILIINASNIYEASLFFITNPLNIWRYILLTCGFYVLTKIRLQRVVILAICFALLEICLNFYIPSTIKELS